MTTHITARLAWHNDGWNGAICRQPELNTYCVGQKSYPGDVIAKERDLAIEKACGGCRGDAVPTGYVPPCSFSYNAFSLHEATAQSKPPDFFFGGAETRTWTLPPSTVCVWSYEAMYSDEVSASGRLDNDVRHAQALEFFKPIQEDCGRNLIFYYANYSNPLSEEEAPVYALIGVSRISSIGEELFYENVSAEVAKKYAGGMVWARNITSHYPNEGLRLPYHLYLHDPELLQQIAVTPENPSLFKYGSKHLTDDDAIGLLEQLLSSVRKLQELGDSSENWAARESWLLKVIAELWTHRGLYPGLLKVLKTAGAEMLIEPVKAACVLQGHPAAHKLAFAALAENEPNVLTYSLDDQARKQMTRNWALLDEGAQTLLRDVLPRLDLDSEMMKSIIDDERQASGLPSDAHLIAGNPFILSERFQERNSGERIAWSAIDRAVLPPPDLGPPLEDMQFNDPRRFRALCVEQLRNKPNHTFRFASAVLDEINTRMARLPEWKRTKFNVRYFKADEEFLAEALTLKESDHGLALYLRWIFDDERILERVYRELATRPDITLKRPVTQDDWKGWVYKSDSVLAVKGGKAYEDAAHEQASICSSLFRRPLSVVTGAAGTGKTSVIEALVRAARRAEGEGASIMVLAPTGKASDRAREVFEKATLKGVETVTVHSFLAANGWLNKNMTFKRAGGKKAGVGTLILDEASMLDIELAAALFRAIDWPQVRRLVLVGDAGQLPPIGRGRVFADLIEWLETEHLESVGRLRLNLRQLLNQVSGKGYAIVTLSELFVVDGHDKSDEKHDAPTTAAQEELIEKLHAGGTIDKDLEVVYWSEPTELAQILIQAVENRMQGDSPPSGEPPYKLWRRSLENDPTAFQVLTPHRAELHGVEAINEVCQNRIAKTIIDRVGVLDGITLFDKVIQVRNRPKSNMLWAYNPTSKQNVQVEVFNGEIGTVSTFDTKVWNRLKTGYGSRLSKFVVNFARKPGFSVGYGKGVGAGPGRWKTEKVEDNLELAYAVSIHKAQGSEFVNTFVIVPAGKGRPLSPELIYTALTRASRHCTLLIERDVRSLLEARRRENAQIPQINSSLFRMHVSNPILLNRQGWYEAGKIHEALSGDMVRSKSEVIISNLLHKGEIPFLYEQLLLAGDGTPRLPDFTLISQGETYYWEHLGMLDQTTYAKEWTRKRAWYEEWFPGRLLVTSEGPQLSSDAEKLILALRSGDLDVIRSYAPIS